MFCTVFGQRASLTYAILNKPHSFDSGYLAYLIPVGFSVRIYRNLCTLRIFLLVVSSVNPIVYIRQSSRQLPFNSAVFMLCEYLFKYMLLNYSSLVLCPRMVCNCNIYLTYFNIRICITVEYMQFSSLHIALFGAYVNFLYISNIAQCPQNISEVYTISCSTPLNNSQNYLIFRTISIFTNMNI